MNHYILVVDGEVAGELPLARITDSQGNLHPAIEKLEAILSSDPKIIVSQEPVPEGLRWNGQGFIDEK